MKDTDTTDVPTRGTDRIDDIDRIDGIVCQALADIAPEADLASLDPAASLQDALDLDSMDFLNVVTALHEATGVDVPERDYAHIDTFSGCDGSIAYHARAAAKVGATPAEVAETLAVALLTDGGTTTVYGPRAWEAFLEFAEQTPDIALAAS